MNWLKERFPNFRVDIEIDGEVYLTRWNIIRLFGWTVRLHKFLRPDADRCLHTHPWAFYTFVLWGGYEEETSEGMESIGSLAGKWRPVSHTHRITRLFRVPTWTLVFTKTAERPWGFITNEGFKHWREFVGVPNQQKALWCGTEGGEDHRGDSTAAPA